MFYAVFLSVKPNRNNQIKFWPKYEAEQILTQTEKSEKICPPEWWNNLIMRDEQSDKVESCFVRRLKNREANIA